MTDDTVALEPPGEPDEPRKPRDPQEPRAPVHQGASPKALPSFRRNAARWLAGLFALLVVLVLGSAAATWWAARTASGSAWLLAQLPGVQVLAPRGALLGDFEVERLSVAPPGSQSSYIFTALGWKGVSVARGTAGRWLSIGLDDLHAARVDIVLAPSTRSSTPAQAPADLRLPVEVDLRSLHIGELHASALGTEPLHDLQARLHLGADGGREHEFDAVLSRDRLRASATGRIAAAGPMELSAALQLQQQAGTGLPPWNAKATLQGPLASPALAATVRAQPAAGLPAQSLDATALLHPFAAWPLGALQANIQALDLSAFGTAMPVTALSGRAVATSTGFDQPARVSLEITNLVAGRWNERRLPLRRMAIEIGALPADPSTLELQAFDADLGSRTASAGHLTGSGHWTAQRWDVAAVLKELQPSLLDGRAAPMKLNGPVALSGIGSNQLTVKADVAGLLTGSTRPVNLKLDASLSPLRVELRSAQLLAGGSRATLTGTILREREGAPWVAKGRAALIDFDPAAWWPGPIDSPWREQPTKLNANGSFDLRIATDIADRPASAMLTALVGQVGLTIAAPSTLVGIPVSGEASLQSNAGDDVLTQWTVDAGGNRLRADGRLSTRGQGEGDRWNLAFEGQALDRLAPLLRLFLAPGADATLAGGLVAKASVSGRWPVLASQGEFQAHDLRLGSFGSRQADASWQFGSTAQAPVKARLTVTGAALQSSAASPGPTLETLELRVEGTGRAHTIEWQAASKGLPPAWIETLQPAASDAPASSATPTPASPAGAAHPSTGTTATLQAQGGFVDLQSAAWAGWRGQINQVEMRSSGQPNAAPPLLRSHGVALQAFWSGGPTRFSVDPGRAELLGGAVRWSRIAWTAAAGAGSHAQLEAQAEIEPLRVAPLLARAQPGFGWGGDLTIAGHLNVRSAPTFSADIVIERSAGDLSVTDELGTQTLGITDLRLALNADHGVWNFTQALAGRTLGVAAGAVVARTSAQATWPEADAPLSGVIQLDVANLGTWGNWVPPGWRLDGALHTSASIGGRFGAPEYTGQIQGSQLAVRNYLQGVSLSDGDVSIRLQGDTAHIEHFTAKGGTGTLRLEGGAVLGSAPKADLQLTAEAFQLLGRVDRRIVASGQARLQLDSRNLALDGKFNVDDGLIDFSRSDAPALADDVDVVRAKGVPSPASAAASAAAPASMPVPGRTLALDLDVTMGEKLRIRGHGLDAGLRGELKLTSPGGRLSVNGSIATVEGSYQAYGQKLNIDRGVITFLGAVDNPRLDIEATRPDLDIRVGVAVSGAVSNPRVRLFSEPDQSDIDKLSWLVLGRASDALGRSDTALLQRAALALLSGEGPGTTDKLIKSLGLDQISVGQSDGEVRETVITLGKQISRRWYIGYERGLNATAGNWQLIYRVAQRITMRAQAGGETSIDLIWTWRWQ